jgi:hypothetical protein
VKLRLRRRTVWTIAIAVAAVAVVSLLVLVGLGLLVLPGENPAPYTVKELVVTILQGTTSSGQGWFGSSPQNYTYPAFPSTFAPGSTFLFRWTFSNFDSSSHNITSVTAGGPFSVVSVSPGLPNTVPRGADAAKLAITIQVPDQAGGSGVVMLTINAVS